MYFCFFSEPSFNNVETFFLIFKDNFLIIRFFKITFFTNFKILTLDRNKILTSGVHTFEHSYLLEMDVSHFIYGLL